MFRISLWALVSLERRRPVRPTLIQFSFDRCYLCEEAFKESKREMGVKSSFLSSVQEGLVSRTGVSPEIHKILFLGRLLRVDLITLGGSEMSVGRCVRPYVLQSVHRKF